MRYKDPMKTVVIRDGFPSPFQGYWALLASHPIFSAVTGPRIITNTDHSIMRDWPFKAAFKLAIAHSIMHRQRLAELADLHGAFDNYGYVAKVFFENWLQRTPQKLTQDHYEILNILREDHSTYTTLHEPVKKVVGHHLALDSANAAKLNLWTHVKTWSAAGVLEENCWQALRLPKERTSQLFLVDYLVSRMWEDYSPATSWLMFKTLMKASDLTLEEMSKAALFFPEVMDYPTSWWAPLLNNHTTPWQEAWPLRKLSRRKTLQYSFLRTKSSLASIGAPAPMKSI